MIRYGYSWETIRANIGELVHAGTPTPNAVAAAFAQGRIAFFRRYPDGLLPAWLAFPRTHRARKFYDNRGKPLVAVRSNPAVRQQLTRAARLFEDFAGHKATTVKRVRIAPLPKAGLAFGEMVEVTYRSFRDGELYKHSFRPKKSRPLLVATYDGKRTLMLGGAYNFTERGIVNAP